MAARALVLYQRGMLDEAAELMGRAFAQAAAPEQPVYRAWSEVMRRAARAGRRLPLSGGAPLP